MSVQHGTNLTNIKEKNRALALRLIATEQSVSRADLARNMHLTKTTLGNIVSELIAKDIIREYTAPVDDSETALGRRPITLDLSLSSPLVMGMLIKRNLLSVILADLKGSILDQINWEYESADADLLIDTLMKLYHTLISRHKRRILAIGISSIGPVDMINRKILSPANFWGIHDLPIASIIEEKTSLPAYLIHDSSAGALAEKIYSKKAKDLDNLLYLHIMNGIGVGYILKGKLYDGDMGQGGELGHMSINFTGPLCNCGNNGCLELYANIHTMNAKMQSLRSIYKGSSLLSPDKNHTWNEIISAATSMDFLATAAVDDFCNYIAFALKNVISLMDIRHIIVGYDSAAHTTILEDTLELKLNSDVAEKDGKIRVEKSYFGSNAPLIGSIAVVTDKIFSGELNIF